MLEIKNYNNQILKNISFKLNNEENLIILGNNGAGKSTLAKVLSNLISNNKVKIFGENFREMNDEKRAKYINYIPPKLEIFDEYITLEEFLNLSFVNSKNNQKVLEVINLLELNNLKDKYCKSFSTGEKQLTLLASSLIHNAKITIFDELTANLDINRIKEVFDIFNSDYLKQKIIITHNIDLAFALKFKILYLEEGRVKFFGTHEEFFKENNLNLFYNNSLLKLENHLVVKL